MSRPQVAVSAVMLRDRDLLLVLRGRGAAHDAWSLPGGRVEFGEDLREAVVREVAEETGLEVIVEHFLGWAERIDTEADPPYHYVILDFLVDVLDPTVDPVPGDDAAEVDWVPLEALDELTLTEGLVEFLEDVGIIEAR